MEKSNPTSPAEELRAAATLIRETAKGTTPTPWRVHLRYYRKSPDTLAGAEFETPLHTSGISLKYPHLLADTQWKALVSPDKAEPLAAWLEATADEYDREPCDDPTGVCNRCEFDPSVLPALTFAAEILGRTS